MLSSDGTEPDRRFIPKLTASRAVSFESAVSIVPDSWLLLTRRVCRAVRVENWDGIKPVSPVFRS